MCSVQEWIFLHNQIILPRKQREMSGHRTLKRKAIHLSPELSVVLKKSIMCHRADPGHYPSLVHFSAWFPQPSSSSWCSPLIILFAHSIPLKQNLTNAANCEATITPPTTYKSVNNLCLYRILASFRKGLVGIEDKNVWKHIATKHTFGNHPTQASYFLFVILRYSLHIVKYTNLKCTYCRL